MENWPFFWLLQEIDVESRSPVDERSLPRALEHWVTSVQSPASEDSSSGSSRISGHPFMMGIVLAIKNYSKEKVK